MESEDCVTGGWVGDIVVCVMSGVRIGVTGIGVVLVTAGRSVTVNVAEAITSRVTTRNLHEVLVCPECGRIHVKGPGVVPAVPGTTFTVPLDPENPLPCTFCVGLNEEE